MVNMFGGFEIKGSEVKGSQSLKLLELEALAAKCAKHVLTSHARGYF